MIWKQCREIRREPTRNKGIHLVTSVLGLVHMLMLFIRKRERHFFFLWSFLYLHKHARWSVFTLYHKVQRHNSPCNKPLSRVLCFA